MCRPKLSNYCTALSYDCTALFDDCLADVLSLLGDIHSVGLHLIYLHTVNVKHLNRFVVLLGFNAVDASSLNIYRVGVDGEVRELRGEHGAGHIIDRSGEVCLSVLNTTLVVVV